MRVPGARRRVGGGAVWAQAETAAHVAADDVGAAAQGRNGGGQVGWEEGGAGAVDGGGEGLQRPWDDQPSHSEAAQEAQASGGSSSGSGVRGDESGAVHGHVEGGGSLPHHLDNHANRPSPLAHWPRVPQATKAFFFNQKVCPKVWYLCTLSKNILLLFLKLGSHHCRENFREQSGVIKSR